MCNAYNSCCYCCYAPTPNLLYYPQPVPAYPYPFGLPVQPSNQQLPPPPVPDQTWHHGYTCCNCQECCDFRDCCDCSGCYYDCILGRNSVPLFNSGVGPLYQYYDGACCRSCFAAQYSGSSCIGSFAPCWLNTLNVVVSSPPPNQLQIIPSIPSTGNISYRPIITSSTTFDMNPTIIPIIPSSLTQSPPLFTTAATSRPFLHPITPRFTGPIPRPPLLLPSLLPPKLIGITPRTI